MLLKGRVRTANSPKEFRIRRSLPRPFLKCPFSSFHPADYWMISLCGAKIVTPKQSKQIEGEKRENITDCDVNI